MSITGKDILINFKKRWQLLLWLEILLYALGFGVLVGLILTSLVWGVFVFTLALIIASILLKPWQVNLGTVSRFADSKMQDLEYSSALLLQNDEALSGLAQLQQEKIATRLANNKSDLKPEVNIWRAVIISSVLILIGFTISQFGWFGFDKARDINSFKEDKITFLPIDSIASETTPPQLIDQQLSIKYPSYTNVPTIITSKMDIKALKGSVLGWKLKFDDEVDSVSMESMGSSYSMKLIEDSYVRNNTLTTSGFYNFKFTDTSGNEYSSSLYSIEIFEDKGPDIEMKGLDQFRSFEPNDKKRFSFSTSITDDFGISETYIIATVSKGSGESVKFREEKLLFEEPVEQGSKKLNLSKKIDLDLLKMEAGDELYFYVEALDQKEPNPNRSRSETFFAVINDTTTTSFGVEGTMGANLMPDYFRSQRQLIIDTEKLISQRSKLSKKEFNKTSNDLGFDQKALRLKYGQFMGDEAESGLAIHNENESPEEGHDEEDPLAEYTHDHDGENEHNLVAKNENDEVEENSKNPLSQFVHDHDNAEEATLFTDSLKSKLRQALNLMWDAELHLRMYEPEKSLPFQYKILKILQDIKNIARIYVHRIGFDPPPIKDDVRLTGKIDEVNNYVKKEELGGVEKGLFMRHAISRLEILKTSQVSVSENDRSIFEKSGNELALVAIENPGKYLETLQLLKLLSQNKKMNDEDLMKIQQGLLNAIGLVKPKPTKKNIYSSDLDELLLKELELNEQ